MTGQSRVSVVVPTRNRPGPLIETLATLRAQTLARDAYEIIVVDDGSEPALAAVPARVRIVRLEGRERSAARNAGARVARGELLAFVDDDIAVGPTFLETHVSAHREWKEALAVGSIRLPEEALARPFGRFRQALERQGIPCRRGITSAKNFCTAANMSIARRHFLELRGFDEALVSAEDQDLALRHSAAGGIIVSLPEAVGIHRDDVMDVHSYCRRAEWGSEQLVAFCRKHPAWSENVIRAEVNGSIRWLHEPVGQSARKVAKKLGAWPLALRILFDVTAVIERVAPESPVLERMYRLLLGVHIYRGYRRGAARSVGAETRLASVLRPKCG